MTRQEPPNSAWRLLNSDSKLGLEGRRAILSTPRLQASSGLQSLDSSFKTAETCTGALWQITTQLDRTQPRPLLEAYVRDDDLIANYGPTEKFPFASQIYWRLLRSDRAVLSVALIVSVQTDLLDTHPVMEISCDLQVDEVLLIQVGDTFAKPFPAAVPVTRLSREVGPHLVLARFSDSDITYAEAIDPSDFCGVELNRFRTDWVRCTWRLFSHFLEKGVIRRARLCSMFVPRENDVDQAVQGFREFLASELPLTA